MQANKVQKLVDKSRVMLDGKRANIIDSKWIFKKKLEADGSIRFTVYYLKETYEPVFKLPVVRSLLVIINKYDWFACQIDVKIAFLNRVLIVLES